MPTATLQNHTAQRPSRLLFWFVGVSILLHMALLWHLQSPATTTGGGGQQAIQWVDFYDEPHPGPTTQTKPAHATQPPAVAEAKPTPAPSVTPEVHPIESEPLLTAERAPVNEPLPIDPGPSAETKESPKELEASPLPPSVIKEESAPQKQLATLTHIEHTLASEIVSTHIQKSLKGYFKHYPMAARKRELEGEVTLGFMVSTEGRIQGIKILHSSGHTLLDNGAIKNLKKVGRLNQQQLIAWGWEPDQEIRIPIKYKLN